MKGTWTRIKQLDSRYLFDLRKNCFLLWISKRVNHSFQQKKEWYLHFFLMFACTKLYTSHWKDNLCIYVVLRWPLRVCVIWRIWGCTYITLRLTSAAVMATESLLASASFQSEHLQHHMQKIRNILEYIVICDAFRVS